MTLSNIFLQVGYMLWQRFICPTKLAPSQQGSSGSWVRTIQPAGARTAHPVSIAAMVPAFGAIAAVMLFSGEGPATIASRVVAVVVIVSTLPARPSVARRELGRSSTYSGGEQSRIEAGVNHLPGYSNGRF